MTGSEPRFDALDRAILAELARNARLPNNALAAAVGIAPSTCLARVRALQAAGVITGFRTEVSMREIGRPLQAMISVGLSGDVRADIRDYARRFIRYPQVLDVYYLAGRDDFLVHVAVRDTDALRDFVTDYLSADPGVARTETSIVFEHLRDLQLFPDPEAPPPSF